MDQEQIYFLDFLDFLFLLDFLLTPPVFVSFRGGAATGSISQVNVNVPDPFESNRGINEVHASTISGLATCPIFSFFNRNASFTLLAYPRFIKA